MQCDHERSCSVHNSNSASVSGVGGESGEIMVPCIGGGRFMGEIEPLQ